GRGSYIYFSGSHRTLSSQLRPVNHPITDPIEKMGRYMATTTTPMPHPTTKITQGSKMEVKVVIVRSTSCSNSSATLSNMTSKAPVDSPTFIICVTIEGKI